MKRSVLLVLGVVGAWHPLNAQLTSLDSARLRAEIATHILEFEWNYNQPVRFRFAPGGDVPDSLVPPAMKVLGGTGRGTLILESPSRVVDAEREIREHLLAKGLTLSVYSQPRPAEGFIFPPARTQGGREYKQYCSPSGLLAVTVRQQWADRYPGSVIFLRFSGQYNGSPCSPEQAMVAVDPAAQESQPLRMPTLRAPQGATSYFSTQLGSGGSSDGSVQRSAGAEVRTSLSPRDLLAHYVEQLKADGWAVGEIAAVAEGAVVSAQKKDAEGRDLQGVLIDIKSPLGTHYVKFQIDRAAPPRVRRP